MKDITTAAGWEKFEFENVSCEICKLGFTDGLDMNSILLAMDKDDIFQPEVQEFFRKYIRNIEGLSVNGNPVTKTEALLDDPDIGRDEFLYDFYTHAMLRFFKLNSVDKEERKK